MTVLVHDSAFSVFTPQGALSEDWALYQTLLESTHAIPWKIDWATMRFTYIGPQIEQLLGWKQDSWQTVDDWIARIHEDDREQSVGTCVAQSQAGIDHEIDYRALTATGELVWIRDVVHVVRNEAGELDSLIGFMFDISERKEAENELLRLQKELERLSFTDGLTGIANRRMFDAKLESEWRCAERSGQPLSLVLFDVDHFKAYNDSCGHVAGDECLKQVAAALDRAGQRPRDVVARFGGEEFVILLPETDEDGARDVAQACLQAIRGLGIAHCGSASSTIVTASAGVGTVTVGRGTEPAGFVRAVDQVLYAAKQNGRDRVQAARISNSQTLPG